MFMSSIMRRRFGMKKTFLSALAVLCIVLVAGSPLWGADKTPEQMVKEAKAAIKEVSIAEVKKMVDTRENVIILDVRDKNELEDGKIPGAMNISRGMLEFKVGMQIPDKTARVVVYCGLDLRGPLATKTLNDLGYVNAVNMAGGLKAWQAAGYPLDK
jgi:sulfur-carrier protein adenylyltransferase/sulfurtransferase